MKTVRNHFWKAALTLALTAFVFTACTQLIDDGGTDDKKSSGGFATIADISDYLARTPGGTATFDLAPLKVSIQLTVENWNSLLAALQTGGKYVALDLSGCVKGVHSSGGGLYANGTFDPDYNISTGKNFIVSLTLPDAATDIAGRPGQYLGSDSFKYFSNFTSISGAGVTSIGPETFYGCTSLASVNLPQATSIDNGDFSGCTSLTSVSLPQATSISGFAFSDCTRLSSVNLPQVTSIDNGAFLGCTGLASVSLPKATGIGDRAFSGCTSLSSVRLGSTVPSVVEYIFRGISNPQTITVKIPAGATGYGEGTYSDSDTSTNNWGNRFRGNNSYISLVFQTVYD